MTNTNFKVNQYIIFKYIDEWHEGRIIYIFINDNKLIYKIFSFKIFSIVQHYVANNILPSTYENLKRVSYNNFNFKIINNSKLISILKYDVQQIEKGKYYKSNEYNLDFIFKNFAHFLTMNNIYLTQEEIKLSVEGLKDLFENYKEYFCFNENEKKLKEVSDFGLVHGIRFAFLVMKQIINKEDDEHIKQLVISIILYFLDYIMLNYDKYYNLENYI